MKFSYAWLKEFVAIKDSPEKLVERLTMRSFEVSGCEKKGGDAILDIALPPNRVPDAAGHIGMAREIAAITGGRVKNQELRIKESAKQKTSNFLSVSIDDKEKCRRYIGRVVLDVRIADSPPWLKNRLVALGMKPINTIVDAANYVMLETGQPLHVFDYEKLEGNTIIVRSSKRGEKMTTLDGQNIELSADDCIIADAKSPLALAGIKGGKKAEVDVNTRHIVLESANFNGTAIRKTASRTGIRTDSSHRFEHDLHPDLAEFAMRRLASLIQRLAGGECLQSAIDVYPKKEKPRALLFHPAYANSISGLQLNALEYKKLLLQAGFSVSGPSSAFRVMAPRYRRDIEYEEDCIEEAVRMKGYEHVPELFPPLTAPPERNETLQWARFICQTLVRLGFSEIYRYSFIGERDIKKSGIRVEDHIELQNPVSEELSYLIREPYENFFRFIGGSNEREGMDVFSIDTGFMHIHGSGADVPIHEERYLTIAHIAPGARQKKDTGENFHRMKGAVSELLDSMGIADHWFDADTTDRARYQKLVLFDHFHPHRKAELKIGEESIGVVGEVHPSILENWGSARRVVIAECLLEPLLRFARSEIEFRPIPKFPAIERDIALLVSALTRIEEVQGIIENMGGAILEDVDFFDEYTGSGIPSGMRSLAFRLVFRDVKKTLSDANVNDAMKKIEAALREKGWEIR